MAIIQANGKVIDIWFTGTRQHEVKALGKGFISVVI